MKYRNVKRNADGSINLEIDHPDFGWIPFTARQDDPEPHGRQIYNDLNDEAGPVDANTADNQLR